ncbi:MAG: class I SAM-dependent methyltransferase [Clostridia bacterium]
MHYTEENSKTWDRWVDEGIVWGIPVSHDEFLRAKDGIWDVLLTPVIPVPHDWFLPFYGAEILGLASGGGQQMPIFTALGAHCTVLDNSEKQLASERLVAQREEYDITVVKGDMTKRLPFDDSRFDLIFHPVSNCYIEDVQHVWHECARILKPGGVLLAGFDNGLNYLFDLDSEPLIVTNPLPFNPLKNPAYLEQLQRDDGGIQFSHSMTEQLGGQLKAGLVLTDLYEDRCTACALGKYMPEFMATRAVKTNIQNFK